MSLLSHESRFSKAPVNNISRSIFDRSNTLVTSFSAGKLVPILLDEVVPGDTCSMDVSTIIRMATPLYPVMDNAWCDLHFFRSFSSRVGSLEKFHGRKFRSLGFQRNL